MSRQRELLLRIVLEALPPPVLIALAAGLSVSAPVTVTIHGGAGEVSGSLAVVHCGETRLMVDCGAYYPEGDGGADERNARAAARNNQLPVSPTECRLLIWTHAHLDHIGRTPLLVRSGFKGAILATEGTAAIAPTMLEMQIRYDSARVRDWRWSRPRAIPGCEAPVVKAHWRSDCEWTHRIAPANRAGFTGTYDELAARLRAAFGAEVEVSPCKVCAKPEVAQVMTLVRPCPYDRDIEVAPNVAARFLYAGHIPGSASVLVTSGRGSSVRSVLFSGDLGNEMSRLTSGPRPAPPADLVVLESTYGGVIRKLDAVAEHRRFRQEVAATVAADGVAWIPAFALDRTQKILWELTTAQREGLLDKNIRIYCPSPSADAITQVYARHVADGWFRPEVAAVAAPFGPAGMSDADLESVPAGPAVVISTSGMMDAAFAGTFAPLLEDPHNTVFLVGYQDPFTPGGALKEQAKSVTINGRRYVALARVAEYGCFSAHIDLSEAREWLVHQRENTLVLLVHGETASLADRAGGLRAGLEVTVAERGITYGTW